MVRNPAQRFTVNFMDNPHAPDVFADRVTGIAFYSGVIRLTFETSRADHSTSPGPVNRVVIGRLIMPLDGVKGLRDLLIEHIDKIEKQGTGVPPAPGPVTVQ